MGAHINQKFWLLTVSCLLAFGLGACVKGTGGSSQGITSSLVKDLPVRIAVLAPETITADKGGTLLDAEDIEYVANLVRGTVANQLTGKGYVVTRLTSMDHILAVSEASTPKELCKALDVDGIAKITITDATMLKTAALDDFSLEATVEVIRKQGTTAATWTAESSKRKVSIPTSLISLAGVLVEGMLSDPARHQMRMVVYDWGWKVGEMIPVSSGRDRLPEVQYVESNVEQKLFGANQSVEVLVAADSDLRCTFDIGDFKKDIPLQPVEKGVYRGIYVVSKDDSAENQPLVIRLTDSKGMERVWLEPDAIITLDGVAPAKPDAVSAKAGRDGVALSWGVPAGEEISGFVVERSSSAAGEYELAGETKDITFTDADAIPGEFAYYRVRTKDQAGNLSAPDSPLSVAVPLREEKELVGEVTGKLLPGVYSVPTTITVPDGTTLTLMPGVEFLFATDAGLDVFGSLESKGEKDNNILFAGADWRGVRIGEKGRADFWNSGFVQCMDCIDSAGVLNVHGTTLAGEGGTGIVAGGNGPVEILDSIVSGFDTAVWLTAPKGVLEESYFSKNVTAVQIDSPGFVVTHNNFADNGQNFAVTGNVTLEANWHGTADPANIAVPDGLMLKSILSAPYPKGAEIVLMDMRTQTPEAREALFAEHKKAGIAAFGERRYGDAVQEFEKAFKFGADRDAYVYMAYVRLALKEEGELEDILDKGLEAFPHETRLYKIYLRYLVGRKKLGLAMDLADKALALNPGDDALKSLKEFVKSQMERDAKE